MGKHAWSLTFSHVSFFTADAVYKAVEEFPANARMVRKAYVRQCFRAFVRMLGDLQPADTELIEEAREVGRRERCGPSFKFGELDVRTNTRLAEGLGSMVADRSPSAQLVPGAEPLELLQKELEDTISRQAKLEQMLGTLVREAQVGAQRQDRLIKEVADLKERVHGHKAKGIERLEPTEIKVRMLRNTPSSARQGGSSNAR